MSIDKLFCYKNAVILFAFFLPISEKISTILIFVCILFLLIDLKLKKIKLKPNKSVYLLLVLFFFFFFSILVFGDDYRFKWLEQRVSLVAFPIIFFGASNINIHKVLKFFVFGCVLAYLICLGNAFYNSFRFESGILEFDPLINNSRGFIEAIAYEGNYFFAKDFSILLQTSYFGFYLTVSFCIAIIYYKNIFDRMLPNFIILCLLCGIIQTMSLASLGGLFFIIIIIIYFYIKNLRNKTIAYGIIVMLIIVSYFVQPRYKIMVNDIIRYNIKINPNERYGIMLRVLSWDASVNIIKKNYVFGVGLTNAQNELNLMYKEKNYKYPLKKELNAHNQFLQLFVECGIFGFIILLLIFFLLMKKSKKVFRKDKILIISFTSLLFFNFLFESYLNRYVGISFFSFFFCLLTSLPIKKDNVQQQKNEIVS